MVFQQRNGRVDRYGQEKTPYLFYLVNQSENPKIKGDMRILELLIQKDEEAVGNIGDPSALMGVYDIDTEEQITAGAIESGMSPEAFEQSLSVKKATFDPGPAHGCKRATLNWIERGRKNAFHAVPL